MQTATLTTTCDGGCGKTFTEESSAGAPRETRLVRGQKFDAQEVIVTLGGQTIVEKKIACSPACARTVLVAAAEDLHNFDFTRAKKRPIASAEAPTKPA